MAAMTQSRRSTDASFPRVVTVAGLKKSGKTTVAEALIAGLKARGYRVGSVKTMSDALRLLDPEGTDTRRHAEAGAETVVALLPGEIVSFTRGTPGSLRDILRFFPPRTDFLVCEGMPSNREEAGTLVLCLRSMDELEETLRVRGIKAASIAAICGVAASTPHVGSEPGEPRLPAPVFDVTDRAQCSALIERVINSFP